MAQSDKAMFSQDSWLKVSANFLKLKQVLSRLMSKPTYMNWSLFACPKWKLPVKGMGMKGPN